MNDHAKPLDNHSGQSSPLYTTVFPLGHAACLAFASIIVMWWIWLLASVPAWRVESREVVGLAVLAGLLATMFAGAWLKPSRRAPLLGLTAGFICGIVTLGILGSELADSGSAPKPPLLVGMAGFLVLTTLLGALGVSAGSALSPRPASPLDQTTCLSVFAIITSIATLTLIVLGGVVTSTRSGLAVPDWPTSFGMNMFLLPIGRMSDPNVFAEHSHRLFGSMVGITTFVLAFYAIASRTTTRNKVWAAVLFTLVAIQGILGALRVTEQNQFLAILHGVLAHVFFALLLALAAGVSPTYQGLNIPREIPDRRFKRFATGFFHLTIAQAVFGATYRHLKVDPGALSHAFLGLHVLVSFGVLVFAGLAGAMALRQAGLESRPVPLRKTLRRLGLATYGVVAVQFVLGWIALVLVMMAGSRGPVPTAETIANDPPVPIAEVIVTTLHHANGAITLGLASLACVWARRIVRQGVPDR
jgi:cytochrome c oxidase assembly protein subunit 15